MTSFSEGLQKEERPQELQERRVTKSCRGRTSSLCPNKSRDLLCSDFRQAKLTRGARADALCVCGGPKRSTIFSGSSSTLCSYRYGAVLY